MAYAVTNLVRQVRLPRTIPCRPTAKHCLYSLADRVGPNGKAAWPSLATMAAEADVDDERTIAARLKSLAAHNLIYEIAPPRQRRPRTWGLNLEVLEALAQGLSRSDPQPDAPLNAPLAPPEVQLCFPEDQFFGLDPQPIAPDPVLLDPVLLDPARARGDYGGDLAGARAVIRELIARVGRRTWAEMVALAERACRDRGVDLGAPQDHVIARAYVLEHLASRFVRVAPRREVVNS